MKNNKCIIAPYIKEKKLPKQEEERLDAINTDIFSRLNASGFFKRTAEGQLHTKSQKLSQASLLVRDINRSFNKNIVSLKKLPLDVKARRKASDFIAHVNVLPLYEEPPTQEQLDNRIALLENEPYIDPQERFSGLRPKVKVVKGKIITDQGIPVEEYLELQDAIYGPQPKNQPEVSNLQYKQGKLFNIQSLKRGAQDFSIEEKYFSEGLETTSGEILKKIANSKHPLAPLAKKLIGYDPEVPIRLVKKDAIDVDGFKAAAVYANKKRYIEVSKYAEFRGLGSEPTLIHEILHAATFEYIRKYPSSKEVKTLSELYNIAKQNSEQLSGDKYALENLDEFVVGIFTDAALVSFLKDLPASESIPKGENLFESILNHILSLFGITEATPSLYSQAFQIASEIVVNNNQEQLFESQFEGQAYESSVKNTAESYDPWETLTHMDKLSGLRNNKDVLQYIETNAESIHSKVASLLLKNHDKIKHVKFMGITDFDNPRSAGMYNFAVGQIAINGPVIHNANRLFHTILHEYVHAFTMSALVTPKTEEDKIFKKEIERLYKETKRATKGSKVYDEYGFSNVYEFVTELMTNVEFIKRVSIDERTILQKFIHALYKLMTGSLPKSSEKLAVEAITKIVEFIPVSSPDLLSENIEINATNNIVNSQNIGNQSKASEKTVTKIRELLNTLGIPVETSERILAEFGANGFADATKGIIEIANGKEDVALTEEAMHMLSMMVPSEVLDTLIDEITKYNIYKDTFRQYSKYSEYQNEDGSPNVEKIKLEAVGKLLAEYYIMSAEDLSPEEVNIAKTLWARIVEWVTSKFAANVDVFQEFINNVNNGTLQLGENFSRAERLANFEFTRHNSEDLAANLTRGTTLADLSDPARSNDKNIKILNDISNLIKSIKIDDLPIMQNLKNYINLPTKKIFATTKLKLEESVDATDIRNRITSAIEYVRNTYTAVAMLEERSNNIRKMLKDGVDINGTALDVKQRLYLFNEIARITELATMYEEHMTEFYLIFEGEQIGMGLDDVINDIKGTASRVIDNNSALDISNLTEVFREALKPKVEGYKRQKMKDILKLQDTLNNTTSASAQAKIQTKIDKLQSEYDNPPISAENVIALITEHDPDEAENKEKIKELRKKLVSASKEEKEKINKQIRKLKGVRIQNPFPLLMEGGLTHKDEAVQAVANLLATGAQEANKESQADVEKYLEIFSRSGLKQNISNSAYNKFTEVVTRYHFDERNGELEEYEEYRLLSEAAQWQFENDIEVLKFLIHIAETNPVEDFIQEEHEKHFGAVLTPAELVDMKGSLEKKLKDLIDNYGERRYIDLYYDIQQILDDVVLSDGRTVREYRQPFADAIAAADDEIELAIDPVTLEIALEDKKTAMFEMSRLESEYDLATGLKKTGDELLVAQTIAQWKSAKRNVEVRPGVVVNVDEWFASNVAKAKWEEEKLAIEDRVSAAEASYALRPSAANRVALEQVSLEYQNWRAQNVKMEIPQAFYDERNDIISAIQDIIDANKADPDIEEAFKEDMDVLWAKIFSATKGLRDSDGIINGILSLSLSNEIKFFEGQIEELKSALKKFRKRFNSDEYMEIMILMDMLDEIQDTPLTKYWDEVYTAMTGQIEADLIARDGEVPTYDQIMMEFKETDFFKTNMLDVTRQYMNTKKADLPKNVIRIKGKTYKPIYTWRQTEPKGQYARVDAMSTTWMSYKVNDEFKNKNYETMQGKVSINPAKVVRNPVTPGRYESPKYAALSASERDFLKEVKEIYYRDQQTKKKSERLGDALPRISSRGLHRKTQLLNPWNWRLKGMFNKQSLLDIFAGLDATEREDVYGEGVSEIGRRTRDAKRQAIKDQRINVMAKYINKSLPIRSQEKDLFRLLTMYNIESHRAAKMKELLPAINTIATNLDKSKNRSKGIMYEINKRVNKKGRMASNTLLRVLDKITDTAHSSLAFTRLFMPHLISSSVKNSAVGAYQIWVNASKLSQYTESSFVAAYMRAFKGALKVTLQQFSSTPSKYMAVVRRLNVSANLDINDATINNADLLLKVANGLGYAAGAQRRVSELHLELTMFELLRKNHGLGGSDLLDLYDYNNGVLTPKIIPVTDVDGNVTMQPAITPEQELGITNRAKNMQQFTQGNFSEDNAIYAKSFWLGRVLLFMKGFIYNPAMVRFGSKRIVSTGQEIEGFYKIALATIFTDTSSLWHPSRLTDNERDAVLKFTKEFILLNGFGLLLYQFSKAMKESGDDDKEEQGLWYLLLMLRRTYSEASFFSPAEAALKPFVLADEDNRVRGNQIESFAEYTIARPAKELAYSAFLPVDVKGMRFEDDDIKTKDPYYSQFKNNWLLFDFLKAIKFKSDMKYPKSTLQSFEYYDKSIYAYEKNKGKAKKTKSNNKKNY